MQYDTINFIFPVGKFCIGFKYCAHRCLHSYNKRLEKEKEEVLPPTAKRPIKTFLQFENTISVSKLVAYYSYIYTSLFYIMPCVEQGSSTFCCIAIFPIKLFSFLSHSASRHVVAKEAFAGVWIDMVFSSQAQTTVEGTFSVKTWRAATTSEMRKTILDSPTPVPHPKTTV